MKHIEDQIIHVNSPLCVTVSKWFKTPERSIHDLIPEAVIVLARAINAFDVERKFKFSTYATNSIMRSLHKYCKVRAPYGVRFVQLKEEFAGKIDQDDVGKAFEDTEYIAEMRRIIQFNLVDLTENELNVLKKRMLAEGDNKLTLEEVGDTMSLSKERARQLEHSVKRKIREYFNELDLMPV